MSAAELWLALSVLLACAVEAVEALTIVLALGATRDWRSAFAGAGAAGAALAAVVAALGPAVSRLPIDSLRLVVGGLLLIFGLQWLRKAILRTAHVKAPHDELAEYREQMAAARERAASARTIDGYAFTVCFKAVLLEGFEVVFIVVSFGAGAHRVGVAAAAAGVAVVLVIAAGAAVRAPLARVPENTLKFAVGIILSAFGMFWGTEGAGAAWPGGELSLAWLIPTTAAFAWLLALVLRRNAAAAMTDRAGAGAIARDLAGSRG